MKKLLLFLVVVLVAALAIAPNVAVAEESNGNSQNSEIYSFVEELCQYNTISKQGVRTFLIDKFSEALGDNGAVDTHQFSISGENYVNIEAKLTKSGATKQIIIGAHYDTVSEGAGDNACGVAAMYFTMKALASNIRSLPCNVVFVAFDGEEAGLLGSENYVGKMAQSVIDDTLVMFNIDTIATGDNLYLHCENKSTDLAKLILSSSEGLQEKPYAKGVFGNTFNAYGYGYYETVQGSDHTPFRLAGIPTALFFSGTYSARFWDYAENSNPNKSVINTPSDTFENLKKNTNFEERIATVSNAVVKTVVSENFLSVGENARKQLVNLNFWYNVLWPIIAVLVVAAVVVVCAIFYYRKLQKNAILGESEIKTQKVFEKPAAEDIFSFKSDDADDIFTYKK